MSREIAIVGLGNQGRAWTENLRDSGWSVRVLLRPGSPHEAQARKFGVDVLPIDTMGDTPLVAFLIPDDAIPSLVKSHGHRLKPHQTVALAHGYAYHFGKLPWPPSVARILVAPKGIGTAVRERYQSGSGVPGVLAVDHDPRNDAWVTAEAIAEGLGMSRVGAYRATVKDEVVADLFSEQALLCGGVPALVAETFKTLVDAGISPETAYLECVHELGFMAELFAKKGFAATLGNVSPTARFGGIDAGVSLVTPEVSSWLRKRLAHVESGEFAEDLRHEADGGFHRTTSAVAALRESLVERVGEKVRQRIREGEKK